jgi:hypothetical protein
MLETAEERTTQKLKSYNEIADLRGKDSSRTPIGRKLLVYKEIWLGVRNDFRTWFVQNAA